MSLTQFEIQFIAALTAAACALPGVFLILQRKAMLTDAISHTVLLGIVLGFFLTGSLGSPLLIIGAASVGVLTVSLVAVLERTRLVKTDAAIGLVFPALFSIAVILISLFAGNIHLDVDAVLVGEIAFAPFDRLQAGAADLGPRGLWVMAGVLAANLVFIGVFYKELKLTTFDGALAAALGFSPVVLHYALMSLVSLTVVSAFDIVGSVLVVALMVASPAAAYLITERLAGMLILSAGFGVVSAVGGYWLAWSLDASIAGAMATTSGLVFFAALLFAPQRGLIAAWRRRYRQRLDFAVTMLAAHLLNHENTPNAGSETRLDHLNRHLRWGSEFAGQVVRRAERAGLVRLAEERLWLTNSGRERASQEFLR